MNCFVVVDILGQILFGTAVVSNSFAQAIIGRIIQAFGRSIAFIIAPVMIKDIGKLKSNSSSFMGSIYPAGVALGSLFLVILSLKNILGSGCGWAYSSFLLTLTQVAVLGAKQ